MKKYYLLIHTTYESFILTDVGVKKYKQYVPDNAMLFCNKDIHQLSNPNIPKFVESEGKSLAVTSYKFSSKLFDHPSHKQDEHID